MKTFLVLCGFLAAVGGVCFVTAEETSKPVDDRPNGESAGSRSVI